MKSTLLFAMLALAAGATQAADLTVSVSNLKSNDGHVLVGAYNRADTFLKQPAFFARVKAEPGTVSATLHDLPAGDYAVSVYQDSNDNMKLDSNPIGMPIEPYGFSRDAAGSYGPPSFEQARISVPAEGSSISVTLR
ncbi:DUF2141 domain-containing protein [Chitinimonas sp.]|uniref:DUF2141 domain-containing protein n=1 Tax=Chitinimonas sp. TaxID=1934313 RepID=UPI002F930390